MSDITQYEWNTKYYKAQTQEQEIKHLKEKFNKLMGYPKKVAADEILTNSETFYIQSMKCDMKSWKSGNRTNYAEKRQQELDDLAKQSKLAVHRLLQLNEYRDEYKNREWEKDLVTHITCMEQGKKSYRILRDAYKQEVAWHNKLRKEYTNNYINEIDNFRKSRILPKKTASDQPIRSNPHSNLQRTREDPFGDFSLIDEETVNTVSGLKSKLKRTLERANDPYSAQWIQIDKDQSQASNQSDYLLQSMTGLNYLRDVSDDKLSSLSLLFDSLE
eukprot:NODE_5587_length_994_cov_43.667049_g5011_i0.p1 GENE.NODE_5587_length_994_cov_43.667049_g5011_i0~~NODE_5587_length_994_cov_43.667049_g5011_i0.p1  ORF type:complete len:274 (+),score=37.46 NODE_5587_length_994_cov_43.667049_g5011_i0:73-894(+)